MRRGPTAERHPVTTEPATESWAQWQQDVLALLRADFQEALHQISLDDIDWPSWRLFFIEGRSPRAAVDRALERDL